MLSLKTRSIDYPMIVTVKHNTSKVAINSHREKENILEDLINTDTISLDNDHTHLTVWKKRIVVQNVQINNIGKLYRATISIIRNIL